MFYSIKKCRTFIFAKFSIDINLVDFFNFA